MEINEITLKSIKQSYYPTIYTNGGVGSQFFEQLSQRNNTPHSSWGKQIYNNLGYYVGATMSIPIFNGFKVKSDIRKSRNDLKYSEYNYQDAKNQLSSDIKLLEKELIFLHMQKIQSINNVENNILANESFRRKFKDGAINILELQLSNNQLLEAEVEHLYIRLNYQVKIRIMNYYKGIPYIKIHSYEEANFPDRDNR